MNQYRGEKKLVEEFTKRLIQFIIIANVQMSLFLSSSNFTREIRTLTELLSQLMEASNI